MRSERKAWWYWLSVWIPLGFWTVDGAPGGLVCAIAFCAVSLADFRLQDGSWAAFPVQVRAGFLLLLLAGIPDALRIVNWIQLAGTGAMLAFDYCPLARLVSLAPWNRGRPLTAAMVRAVLLTPPSRWPRVRRRLMHPPAVSVVSTPYPV
jgi:hypothetical protein